MIFRPRSTILIVGVRPVIEVRPILGNLRYIYESKNSTMSSSSHNRGQFYLFYIL